MYGRFPSLIVKTGTSSSYDSDAQAFITAAGITNTTQKNAVNQLVIDYKAAGIWTKMIALYPMVGGTASTHSYNLKNPAAYQITWNGTVTHNSNGVTGNGSTGYGNTGIVPSTVLTLNSIHLSFYCRTNSSVSVYDMGATDGTNQTNLMNFSSVLYSALSNNTYTQVSMANTQGGFTSVRSSSSNTDLYKNGSNVATSSSNNSVALTSTYPIYILGNNFTGSLGNASDRNFGMFSVGTALTSTETANKYTADQVFQTALGRNV